MKTLLQINLCVNCLSTGKISEDIGLAAMQAGWKSYIAGAVIGKNPSKSNVIRIGSSKYIYFPYFESLVFDNHCLGLSARMTTKRLIAEIEKIKPDLIQLHTIHAYYLNLKLLFEYFATINTPIVWTLHDCWSFTGHCAYFDAVGCEQWKTQCHRCPQLKEYPRSLGWFDNSRNNYDLKKKLFTSLGDRLTLVPVSNWISNLLSESFLSEVNRTTIHNGINLSAFKPTFGRFAKMSGIEDKRIVLGVASAWGKRKGLEDFFKLDKILDHEKYQIILVGLNANQLKRLPEGIIGITLTESIEQLAELYTLATVFVNPTYEDTYPTVNLESMACGTPVIAYNTGGCPEAISLGYGTVIEKGNIYGLKEAIESYSELDKIEISELCRAKSLKNFDKTICFHKYIELYNSIIGSHD